MMLRAKTHLPKQRMSLTSSSVVVVMRVVAKSSGTRRSSSGTAKTQLGFSTLSPNSPSKANAPLKIIKMRCIQSIRNLAQQRPCRLGCLDTAINTRAGTSPKPFGLKQAPFTQKPTGQSCVFENLPLNNMWMCPHSKKRAAYKNHLSSLSCKTIVYVQLTGLLHRKLFTSGTSKMLLWGWAKSQGAFCRGCAGCSGSSDHTHLSSLGKRTHESVCGVEKSRANAIARRHWNPSVISKATKTEEGKNTPSRNWFCYSVKIPVEPSRQG